MIFNHLHPLFLVQQDPSPYARPLLPHEPIVFGHSTEHICGILRDNPSSQRCQQGDYSSYMSYKSSWLIRFSCCWPYSCERTREEACGELRLPLWYTSGCTSQPVSCRSGLCFRSHSARQPDTHLPRQARYDPPPPQIRAMASHQL